MRYRFALSSCLVLLTSLSAIAQDVTAIEVTSSAEESEVSEGYLGREVLGIKPQFGAILLNDADGDSTSRATAGFVTELNLTPSSTSLYFGPSTGLFYSHFGASGSNFFGSDAPEGEPGANTNFLMIPANLKLGLLLPSGSIRLSLRGGANAIYRSTTVSTSIGEQEAAATGSDWAFYPNVGADFEFGPVMLRPDWTITSGDDVFTATAGVVLPIG